MEEAEKRCMPRSFTTELHESLALHLVYVLSSDRILLHSRQLLMAKGGLKMEPSCSHISRDVAVGPSQDDDVEASDRSQSSQSMDVGNGPCLRLPNSMRRGLSD